MPASRSPSELSAHQMGLPLAGTDPIEDQSLSVLILSLLWLLGNRHSYLSPIVCSCTSTSQHSALKYVHTVSFHFISFHFISFHFISFHFISFHFISFISFHFISFHFISFHFISFHFISFHSFHSFHFISFHFISFHFISFISFQQLHSRARGTRTHSVAGVTSHAVVHKSVLSQVVQRVLPPPLSLCCSFRHVSSSLTACTLVARALLSLWRRPGLFVVCRLVGRVTCSGSVPRWRFPLRSLSALRAGELTDLGMLSEALSAKELFCILGRSWGKTSAASSWTTCTASLPGSTVPSSIPASSLQVGYLVYWYDSRYCLF